MEPVDSVRPNFPPLLKKRTSQTIGTDVPRATYAKKQRKRRNSLSLSSRDTTREYSILVVEMETRKRGGEDSQIFFFPLAWDDLFGRWSCWPRFRKHSSTYIYIYIYRGKRGLTCVGVDGETAVGLDHRVPEQRVLAEIGIGGAHGSDQRTRGQVLQQLESVKLLLEAGIVVVVVEHRDQHGSARCRGGGTVVGREHRERVSIRALSIEHLRQINPSGVGADSKRRRSLEPVTQPSVVARVQVDRGHLEYLRCIYNRTRLYICINILLRQQGKKKKRVPFGWKDGRKSEREREKEAARRHKRPVYPVVPY